MKENSIYTIGYGNRTEEEFFRQLAIYKIQYLIDIRSRPRSRFKPVFSAKNLAERAKLHGVRYVYFGEELGGLPKDESCYTDGRVDYLKCKERPLFQEGIARVITAWQKKLSIVLMCSESKPEECHRSKLIGAFLSEKLIEMSHIDEKGTVLSQDQVIQRLVDQSNLFNSATSISMSRKQYYPSLRN